MGKGPKYKVAFKRRRQGKTNYRLRRNMVVSNIPRLVTRKSLKHITVQLMTAMPEGDKTLMACHSRELVKDFNWKATCDNLPAAYLIGLISGFRALSIGVNHSILDIGLQTPSPGSRVFAVLKGALQAGLNIPCNKAILPDDSRVKGEHIASYAQKLFEADPELYENKFSGYLSKGLKPEKIVEYINQVKNNIERLKGDKNG